MSERPLREWEVRKSPKAIIDNQLAKGGTPLVSIGLGLTPSPQESGCSTPGKGDDDER